MANNVPQAVIDSMMGHSYKGPYAKGIMEAGMTNADIRAGVANAEIDIYIRAGYSGDAIAQFSGSNVEGKPRIKVKAGTGPIDPPDLPPQDPPSTGGTTTTSTNTKPTKTNWAKKWGGRFLKYVVPSLLSPQALTAELVLEAGPTGDSVDQQINKIMQENNISEAKAIELFKENPPLEAPEGVYGIGPYEEKFKKRQIKKEQIAQEDANFAEIMQKGLMEADIKYPNE